METNHDITLKFSTGFTPLPLFSTVQDDNITRKITATIFNDDGTPFVPDLDAEVIFCTHNADGEEFSHPATILGNIVTVVLTNQDLSVPGNVYSVIRFIKGDVSLSTVPFVFDNIRHTSGLWDI